MLRILIFTQKSKCLLRLGVRIADSLDVMRGEMNEPSIGASAIYAEKAQLRFTILTNYTKFIVRRAGGAMVGTAQNTDVILILADHFLNSLESFNSLRLA